MFDDIGLVEWPLETHKQRVRYFCMNNSISIGK